MRYHLIARLRAPVTTGPFKVDIDTQMFRIKLAGFAGTAPEKLNLALSTLKNNYPDALLFSGFQKFIRQLRQQRGTDGDLALYFRIAFPDGVSESAIVVAGRKLQREGRLVERFTTGLGFRPTMGEDLGYLESSERGGHHVFTAWDLPGGKGQNATVILVDDGYQKVHVDLPKHPRLKYVDPEPLAKGEDHGTKVLGVLAAQPETAPLGVAHGASYGLASTVPQTAPGVPLDSGGNVPAPDDPFWIVWAMGNALANAGLGKGGILLLVYETYEGYPMEAYEDIAAAIRDATDIGIMVVESAGNRGQNVDGQVPPLGTDEDTGAVMVGAGQSTENQPLTPMAQSNYGDRVNCQAWGEGFFTTYVNVDTTAPPDDPGWYTDDFGLTSGASAIVAGLVAVIQSIHYEATRAALNQPGAFLPPADIRQSLMDEDLGLRQVEGEHIGPQPDLLAILDHLDLLPDIFIRDNLLDDGSEPSASQDIWTSPDIITRPGVIENPAITLGDWDDEDLSENPVFGQENAIYIRAGNRGPFDDTPKITVYWAYPGTFLDPANWHLIGEVTPEVSGIVRERLENKIPRALSGPLRWWPPGDTTHPCLIAVANSVYDNVPILTNLSSTIEYVEFMRAHNNLAHRNVQVSGASSMIVVWRFNVIVPRVPWIAETRVRVTPKNASSEARLFIGLPPNHEEQLIGAIGAPGPEDIGALVAEYQRISGHEAADFERRMRTASGDRRHMNDMPLKWIIRQPEELTFEHVSTPVAKEIPLIVGAFFSPDDDPSDFEVDVVQELEDIVVGWAHLRTAGA